MSRRRVRPRGFTLIELLVVIAVIVILAAIVLPVFSGVQRRARMTQCMSNLSSIAVAMKLYRQEWKRFPRACLAGTGFEDNLPDLDGNDAYTATEYHTFDDSSGHSTGRKSRTNALFPNFLEDQKSLICPDENEESALLAGNPDPAGALLNGQDPADALAVASTTNFATSTYDDFYNAFGYSASESALLKWGTPILTRAGQVQGGRKAPRLNNPYAPGSTIITYCREHEEGYDNEAAAVSLIVRVSGKTEKVIRAQYAWATQAEQVYD